MVGELQSNFHSISKIHIASDRPPLTEFGSYPLVSRGMSSDLTLA
jgi:hypothetical protein